MPRMWHPRTCPEPRHCLGCAARRQCNFGLRGTGSPRRSVYSSTKIFGGGMIVRSFQNALSVGASAAFFTACSGSHAVFGTPGVAPQGAMAAVHSNSGSYGDLLYVTSVPDLTILSYPQGKVVARISGNYGNSTICSDPNNGNVFVLNPGNIEEYTHGGTTPIATLSYPPGYDYIDDCAVDPTTGNLAAATGFPGGVLIWSKAQGNPTWYGDRKFRSCLDPIYDSSGNLFVNADNVHERFRLAKLRAGNTDFSIIDYPKGSGIDFAIFPPAMQWDGQYLAFQENEYSGYGNVLFQVRVNGRRSKIVNTSHLLRQSRDRNYILHGGFLFGLYNRERNDNDYAIAVWKYPKGGKPIDHFYGVKNGPYANNPQLTLSVGPSH